MSRYAVIDKSGVVINVIEWDGETNVDENTINSAVKSDNANIGGTIIDGIYSPPLASNYAQTIDDINNAAMGKISAMLALATGKIAQLQDAVDLGIATTAETASLTAWKTYRVAVNRVPTQSGFPTTIDWPPVPE